MPSAVISDKNIYTL